MCLAAWSSTAATTGPHTHTSPPTADAPSSPPVMQLLGGGELPPDVMFAEQMLDQEEPGTPSLISSFDTHVGGRGGTACCVSFPLL